MQLSNGAATANHLSLVGATKRDVMLGEQLSIWRRRRGASQLDLALEINSTTRHISYIETGRARPGRALLLRIFQVLDIRIADGNAILAAAGMAPTLGAMRPPVEEYRPPVPEIPDRIIGRLLDMHDPLPAFARDRSFNVTGANRAARRMLGEHTAENEPLNSMELAFAPTRFRSALVNWPEMVGGTLLTLRRLVVQSGGAPEFVSWFEKIKYYARDLPSIPDMEDRLGSPPFTIRMGGEIVPFVFVSTALSLSIGDGFPERMIVKLYPAGHVTDRQLREHPMPPSPVPSGPAKAAQL